MATSSSIDITYVPADCGSVIYGKSKAPAAFKRLGIANQLIAANVSTVEQHEALSVPANWQMTSFTAGSVRNESLNLDICNKVRDTLSANLSRQSRQPPFQLVLGGECCMLPGILSAFWSRGASLGQRVGLIYIDADTDLNAPSDPRSTGNLAAQTLTHLIGADGGLESMRAFSRPDGKPPCDASNTVLFGLNMSFPGNKPEHFDYLFDKQYRVIPSSAVADAPEKQAAAALEYLEAQGVDTIVVHLDVDAIDPGEFPLANLPNYTGVKFESMMKALGVMLTHDKAAGLSVAEVNPDHDPDLVMTQMLTRELTNMLSRRR